MQQMSDNIQNLPEFSVRHYQNADLDGLRAIYGDDEFARPHLLQKYPRMREYLADEVLYYFTRYEPESLFVAEAQGEIIGALLGAINTPHQAQIYRRSTRPYLALRCLAGAYGWPAWALPVIRTEFAGWNLITPKVNRKLYPAHLHIGVLPAWRRHGVGTALMDSYAGYLRQKNVAGYHLYCSSFGVGLLS